MSAYSDYVLSLSPSLYWKLNSSTGATDLSGSGRNGTGQGSVSVGGHTATYAPVVGESQACTDFDGLDDYVSSTYDPFTTSTVRTFTGWAYRDNTSANHCLFGSASGNGAPLFMCNSGSQDVLFVSDATGATNTFTAAWPGNTQWVFWALKFTSSGPTVELFINGSSFASQAAQRDWYGTSGPLWLGEWTASRPWDGRMAHFSVFETGLTNQQIASLYDIGINGGHRGSAKMSSPLRGGVHRG